MLRRVTRSILCLLLYLSICSPVFAESVKLYNVVVPFSAGGASDVLFRGIEPALNARLAAHNIKLIILNSPGAGGSIGLTRVLNNTSTPTFGFFSPFFAINKTMRNDPYDFDSVRFLGFAGYNRMVVISGKHAGITALNAHCATGSEIVIGSSGVGSTSHLSGIYFAKKYLKCNKIISVPYKATSLVYPDLIAGRVDIMADFTITAESFISNKYLYKVEEIKDTDLLSWHIFVSNNIDNSDIDIVKREFELLKMDKSFVNAIESKFHIFKFSENKDMLWLKTEFRNYKNIIESLPQAPRN